LTRGTNQGRSYPNLIPSIRRVLVKSGRPFVIENVVGAPVRPDVVLCGEMFGLAVLRHRLFELGRWRANQPPHKPHRGRVSGMRHGEWFTGPYVAVYGDGGGKGSVAQWREAMGIDWTWSRPSIAQAIPPAYSLWIGERLMDATLEAAA
jgi:DNA (cytosine-5)-methyltransferase 1